MDLATICPAKSPLPDLEYRFLTADDIRAAVADPANDLDITMADRLQSGRDFCFAAFFGNRLANYSWYALEAIGPEDSFGAGLILPRDTVYMYKAYTVPAYRGQQIHGAVLLKAAQYFQQLGITQLIAIVEFANGPSLRSHLRLGCRPAGRLLRIGRKSWGWRCGSLLQRSEPRR
jgi:hypothetical protein